MGQVYAPRLQIGPQGQTIFAPSIEVQSNGATDLAPGILVWRDDGILQANITSLGYGLQGGGTFHANFARGTRLAPLQVLAGDITGGIGSRAYDGVSFQTSSPASIHWQVTQDQTPAQSAMWLRFLTTPKGTTVRQERGGITDFGSMWIHDTGTYDPLIQAQIQPIADCQFIASATAPTTGANYLAVGHGAGVSAGYRGVATRGTALNPTASQLDDLLAFLAGHGFGATAYSAASKGLVAIRADQNWTDAAQGTRLEFGTVTNGTTARVTRGIFDGNATAGETALLLGVAGAAPIRVSVGAADSGGVGFRMLRVPN